MIKQRKPIIDPSAARSWIYPCSSNYEVRQYQLSICKQTLFTNTLVCLPTGLGKTLIAAVTMYNYYRWFPNGKVVFLAPTKPLVSQQIDACCGIMGIPRDHTAHLEGSVPQERRGTLWLCKRVFFCTPQTLHNDIKSNRCDASSIVCIVVDEAHRATGSYAYATALQEMAMRSDQFRVLALSATPGTDARKVQTVIRNLFISHVEIRTEDDPEIVPYIHQRQIEHIVCPRGVVQGVAEVRKQLNSLIQFPLQCLVQCNIISADNPNALNYLVIEDADR